MGAISRGKPAVWLRLVSVVLAGMLSVVLSAPLAEIACESRVPTQEQATMTEVFAQTEWYREQPEIEREYRGEFQRREVAAGPAARTALRYTLVTDSGPLAVYAPNNVGTLEPFVGCRVRIWGKLVTYNTAVGRELWSGSIDTTEAIQ